MPEGGNVFTGNSLDPTEALSRWSAAFGRLVSERVANRTVKVHKSFYGRSELDRLQRPGYLTSRLTKLHKFGEVNQSNGFLNRADKAALNFRACAALLWQNIFSARGFEGGFGAWWPRRHVQLQGSSAALPSYPPAKELAMLLLDDFWQNYLRSEHWQSLRRMENRRAKVQAISRMGLFAAARKTA